MQTHKLKRKTDRVTSMQVGRGGTRGKTSGKGTKGQKARAGRKIRPEIRDIIKRLPKLRGYNFKSIEQKAQVVSLDSLQKNFKANETVSPSTLIEKKLVRRISGNAPRVKVLSNGEIQKALTFVQCEMSAGAKEKILKAGGVIQ